MSSNKAWRADCSFVIRRLDVLQSMAWKSAPRALKAILEELEIELMRHKGATNGQIFRSYTQLEEAGFNRGTVSEMIRIGEALGFLIVERNTLVKAADLRPACAYTLTYLPTGFAREKAPSDEWKRIKTEEQALRLIEGARKPTRKTAETKRRKVA